MANDQRGASCAAAGEASKASARTEVAAASLIGFIAGIPVSRDN
jgi:hypothetical protein